MSNKWANTDTLLKLNDWASDNDMNRYIPSHLINEIDPDGVHLCSGAFIHSHRAGIKVEDHLRTMWLIKLKGKDLPTTAFIDVPFLLFIEECSDLEGLMDKKELKRCFY